MIRIREALVVEGKYDVMRLRQVVDTLVIATGGFRIFKDADRVQWLRRLAQTRGLIVLTDSDGAGLVIRRFLQGVLPPEQIRQAYIPMIAGKEKRKVHPSAEGLLGVEGMDEQTLLQALVRAGAHIEGEDAPSQQAFTVAELYTDGLIGKADSAALRRTLLTQLQLPTYLSAKHLPQVLGGCVSREQYRQQLHIARENLKKENKSS